MWSTRDFWIFANQMRPETQEELGAWGPMTLSWPCKLTLRSLPALCSCSGFLEAGLLGSLSTGPAAV